MVGEGDFMSIQGKEVIRAMEVIAPPYLAVSEDPIGLQVGDPNQEVKGILVTLDVTEEVVDEAIAKGVNWIITHHAVIYRPLPTIRTDQPSGRVMAKLLANGIQVYCAHTNLDAAKGGVNDVLAEKLGLTSLVDLIPTYEEKLKKLVVFVPEDHHDQVLKAVCDQGAGWIGNYSHCTFNTEGTGTFYPQEGAQPFIGEQGKLEKVKELRLETIVPERLLPAVIDAMLKAHPYEEVAYDVYPLDLPGKVQGFGKVGLLSNPMKLNQFALYVKEAFGVDGLRVVGDLEKSVQKVAILGGSGGRYFTEAMKKGTDVYITGDIDYHVAQDALSLGLAIIDPGHHIEHHVVEAVVKSLKNQLGEAVPILPSKVNTNPFRFI